MYTPDEVAAICDAAHRLGMTVHIDGARIANATAALGGDVAALRSFTVDAGVDVITFGGTKNGLLGGEAVVFLRPELARRAQYVRKQVTQLPSKMRFVAAQFLALLDDDRWLAAGRALQRHGRAPARGDRRPAGRRGGRTAGQQPVPLAAGRRSSSRCATWCFFWDWDAARHQVRWMTAWDTTRGRRRRLRRRRDVRH